MIRHALSLVGAALLVAAVGAQGPKDVPPAQRAELYKKNRAVIEQLVEKTVESARTPNDHVKRADTYYKVLFQFNTEIKKAKDANDADRAAELTGHLKTLLDQGLNPTLKDARKLVENGTGVEEFLQVRGDLLAQLTALIDMPGQDPAAKTSLEQTRDRLNQITIPKKK